MSQFPLARILDFVGKIVPFDVLTEEELQRVVGLMDIAYFPRDQVIIRAGGEPADFLYIIHSGSVKVTVPAGDEDEILVDVRGEGEAFGSVSILQGKKALFSVTAREDLITFLLPAEEFKKLADGKSNFKEHFNFALARNLQSVRTYCETQAGPASGAASVNEMAAQARRRVGDLMSNNVLTCSPKHTIKEAAQAMTKRRVGSIVVTNEQDEPLGVITDTDMRTRVLARGMDPDTSVTAVMSSPPLTISHQAFGFEAMLDMARHGVHHLLVADGKRMAGVISDHDLLVVTGSSPVGLVREIDTATSIDELRRVPQRTVSILEMLLNMGSSAEYIMDLMTEMMDRLTLKLFDVTEQEMESGGLGGIPVDFCWLALGAGGRREQAPPVHQFNALVFADVPEERMGVIREWFLGFTRRVCDGLAQCGRPFCHEGIMAKESRWCLSAKRWRQFCLDLVRAPTEGTWNDPGMFLDFRPVQGETAFAHDLRLGIWDSMDENRDFLMHLFQQSAYQTIPLGFLRQLVVERDGDYTELLDMERLMRPMVDGARTLAMEHRISETNTLDRISELTNMGVIDGRLAQDLREAFSYITMMRISRYLKHQKEDTGEGDQLDPVCLSGIQRKMFKETFSVVARFQEFLIKRYGLPPKAMVRGRV